MIDNPIPKRIHRGDREIVVTWNDEHVGRYPSRELRLACHCAACREEFTGRRLLDPAAVASDIRPLAIRLVGSYGMRIDWSDGHGTGIYTWRQLLELCPCERCGGQRGMTA